MPAIIEWPTVVKEALARYGDLFKNEPERRHFAEFALTTDQSCLNRWINEVAWDVHALNLA